MLDVDRAMEFIDFVKERHAVYTRRMAGEPGPWTEDPILRSRKFTNCFRWLDPGSQFVITDLMCDDPETFLVRCFLYRHTNLPEAWRAYAADTGHYPGLDDLDDVRDFWLGYKDEGGRVFSGAYMIYPQSSVAGTDKICSVTDLTKRLRDQGDFFAFTYRNSQEKRFDILRKNKGVADFMSMQILTDFGYSTEFREDQFVVPGPGAKKGAAFLGIPAPEAIHWGWLTMLQEDLLEVEGRGRFLSKMDIQNALCEYSKYARYSEKPAKETSYQPTHSVAQLRPVLPPKWI